MRRSVENANDEKDSSHSVGMRPQAPRDCIPNGMQHIFIGTLHFYRAMHPYRMHFELAVKLYRPFPDDALNFTEHLSGICGISIKLNNCSAYSETVSENRYSDQQLCVTFSENFAKSLDDFETFSDDFIKAFDKFETFSAGIINRCTQMFCQYHLFHLKNLLITRFRTESRRTQREEKKAGQSRRECRCVGVDLFLSMM